MKNALKKGFTLIELMVVVIIVGILAAVAVPKMAANKDRAIASEAVASLGTLNSAAAMYQIENPNDTTVTIEELIDSGYITVTDLNGTYFEGSAYSDTSVQWNDTDKKFSTLAAGLTAKAIGTGAAKVYDITWSTTNNAYQTKVQ